MNPEVQPAEPDEEDQRHGGCPERERLPRAGTLPDDERKRRESRGRHGRMAARKRVGLEVNEAKLWPWAMEQKLEQRIEDGCAAEHEDQRGRVLRAAPTSKDRCHRADEEEQDDAVPSGSRRASQR